MTKKVKRKKSPKLTRAEQDWLKDMAAWIADHRLDVEQHARTIVNHQEEITTHREHVRLIRIQHGVSLRRVAKGVRMVAKWKREKGLPA